MSDFDKDPSSETFTSQKVTIPSSIPTDVVILSEPASLVTQMKRECFGNTYSLKATYETSNTNCIVEKRLAFYFANGTTPGTEDAFQFTASYTLVDGVPTRLQYNSSTYPGSSILSDSIAETNQLSLELDADPSSQAFEIVVKYNKPNVEYKVLVENIISTADPAVTVTVKQEAIIYVNAEQLLNLRTVYGGGEWKGVPLINVLSTTEFYYGNNLGQVGFDNLRSKEKCLSKSGDVKYMNCVVQESDYPKLTKVVAGEGKTLVEKVFYLGSKYRPDLLKITFLSLLVTYAMLRYYLWKLINCKFDITILYRERSEEFIDALKGTVYWEYKKVFTETDIKGFGNYFLYTRP